MPFEIGTRVWAQVEGFPFWPAKVLFPETVGYSYPDGKDVFVQFYGTGDYDFFKSSEPSVVAFSNDEEKENAEAEGLAAAVAECRQDDSALPLAGASTAVAGIAPTGKFLAGHQVWVNRGGDDWWPAKVVPSPEAYPAGRDTYVVFYGSEKGTFVSSGSSSSVLFFETRSQKAATGDEAKKTAILLAEADSDIIAAPVETNAVEAKRPREQPKEREAKRVRKETKKPAAPIATANSTHSEMSPAQRTVPDAKMLTYRQRLEEACDNDDFPVARKQLIELCDIAVSQHQLSVTKIGVAVGKVLHKQEFARAHPLASAIIHKWAGALPLETREAIAHSHKYRNGGDSLTAGSAPAAIATSAAPTAGRKGFIETLVELLSRPEELAELGPEANPTEVATQMAGFFSTHHRGKDLRMTAVEQLKRDGHVRLRKAILKGEVTPRDFSNFTTDDLKTDAEKEDERAKMQAAIELRDQTESEMYVPSEMFECPRCKHQKTIYHEQQTRGADEPTTKFVKCLSCGHNWTCE